jgi:hypothetical protein
MLLALRNMDWVAPKAFTHYLGYCARIAHLNARCQEKHLHRVTRFLQLADDIVT